MNCWGDFFMKESSNEIGELVRTDDSVDRNEDIVDLSALETYMNDFCTKNDLKTGQILTNDHIHKIFRLLPSVSIVYFDSLQDFMEKYLKSGEKISFDTLSLFLPPNTKDIQNCTLGKLRTFIEKYIDRSKTYLSNTDDKIKENEIVTSNNFDTNISNDLAQMQLSNENKEELKFLGNLFECVKSDKGLLDEKNKEHIKYFTGWQEQLLNNIISKIMDENYAAINHLALELLKFKYETKQYTDLNDLQNDILQYVKSIVFYYGQSDRGAYALDAYLYQVKNLFDEYTLRRIFNHEFVQELKNVILGEERKITKFYQIEFLRSVLDIDSNLNKKSYSFDEAYDFIFEGQDKSKIQQIVSKILARKLLYDKYSPTDICNYESFVRKFVSLSVNENLNIDSKQFKTFCEVFYLRSETGNNKGYHKSTSAISKMSPQDLQTSVSVSVKDYLSSEYFLPQRNVSLSGYANSKVQQLYYREFYFTFLEDRNDIQIANALACQTDNKIDFRIKSSLMYTQNTRIYEIFIGAVFLVLGFVSLIVLKSVFDILSLPIKVIINVFCSAIVAFKREEYFWMIILPLKELFLGVLFVVFSPIICLVNNFLGSKHLFHISGSGRKLVTFSNWSFYNSKDKVYDFDDLKNFNLTDINLWFFIKYIFGFGCVVRLKKSEYLDLIAEIKLTSENQVDKKNSKVKVCNETFRSHHCPYLRYTNEYSPLRYFERT